jgi:hypothetical protein
MLEIPAPHFELIAGCKNSPQHGGAIYVDQGATCNIDGGTFLSNGAVSQQRKKPSLTSPFTRKMLEIPGPHFELIVGCKHSLQAGGAIYIDQGATCNIDGGTFLSNTADDVSQQRKKPSLTSPFAPGISNLFSLC